MTDKIFPKDDLIGVVLMGGKSSRMGRDKSLLELNNQSLYKIAGQKLVIYCNQVFLSVNEKQKSENSYEYPCITDLYEAEGPIGAILSCMNKLETSILFLACDMPIIDSDDIKTLIEKRQKNHICTAFFHPEKQIYEPLFSIWETTSLPLLETYFANGNRSLQKFLHQQNIPKIKMPNPENFKNINHLEEWKSISENAYSDLKKYIQKPKDIF
ncbi:MAG TPA: molybdenum cofactor guanylyltransferase [Saprospiraceae bacterium]|nr:molybdenum cofactor guanylyltransferase [Saprospiraceae bacterium]